MPVDDRLLRLSWGIAVLATVVVLTIIEAPVAVIMAVLVTLPSTLEPGGRRPGTRLALKGPEAQRRPGS